MTHFTTRIRHCGDPNHSWRYWVIDAAAVHTMSSQAFVYSFRDGEVAGISRQQVRDAFGAFLTEGGVYDWQLDYSEADSCDVMLEVDKADEKLLRGFTVMRPCGDERFWDALASILHLGNLVLFFSFDCTPLIADRKVALHLPSDMVESVKCVTTGKEILAAIQEAD